MLDILRNIGAEYQAREDERLYGGGASGGLPFILGSHPDNRPQRNQLGDMLTGKMARRKEQERKAGQALINYFGIG